MSMFISLPILLITFLLTLILKSKPMQTFNELFIKENFITILFIVLLFLVILLLIRNLIGMKKNIKDIGVDYDEVNSKKEITDSEIEAILLRQLYKFEKGWSITTKRLRDLVPGASRYDIKEFLDEYKSIGVIERKYTMENGKFTGSGFCLTDLGRDYVKEKFSDLS